MDCCLDFFSIHSADAVQKLRDASKAAEEAVALREMLDDASKKRLEAVIEIDELKRAQTSLQARLDGANAKCQSAEEHARMLELKASELKTESDAKIRRLETVNDDLKAKLQETGDLKAVRIATELSSNKGSLLKVKPNLFSYS